MSADAVDVKLHCFVVMTYSGSWMCLDSKVDVKVLLRANPLALRHLTETVSIVLPLHHSLQGPASEEILLKVMTCLVAHLDASIYSVNVSRSSSKIRQCQDIVSNHPLCSSSLMSLEDWGSESSMPREMMGSASEGSYSSRGRW